MPADAQDSKNPPEPSTPDSAPPDRAALDEAEWSNRANWKLGHFYFSEADSRIWVPKRSTMGRRRMGSTPNLAKPQARAYLKIVIGGFALLFLLVVLLEKLGILR